MYKYKYSKRPVETAAQKVQLDVAIYHYKGT